MKMWRKQIALFVAAILLAIICIPTLKTTAASDEIVLRVCNWEEYIDEGGWDEDEVIDLESGDIFGESSIVEDFEKWYFETYGKKVRVEYSTFGTNEELYSQLTLGDTYDLVCPSDYMIMKLMNEGMLEPLSDEFFDEDNEYNYYIKGVSPYIRQVFAENEINGEPWEKYAAGYMWGITGFLYNPDEVDEEDVKTWSALLNDKYYRQITIKDNVRDAYFPTMAIINKELLLSEDFISSPYYHTELAKIMNVTDSEAIKAAEQTLKDIRANVYSFETDSGKADMVSGKVLINLQWSGDAVYAMDQAEEDDLYLAWAVPDECTNLWFDGFTMLKSGINGDANKKHAAEAFLNFISRPDNAVRNMYYIGYSGAIAGGDDSRVWEYLEWCYGAEDDEEDVFEYDLGYFFDNIDSEDYILVAPAEQANRQLSAQYPSYDQIEKSAYMLYFDDKANAEINQMWINVRCFNLSMITGTQWLIMVSVLLAIVAVVVVILKRDVIFAKREPKGYKKVN